MNLWENTVITDKGAALQNKLFSGQPLQITGAAAGTKKVPAVNLRSQTDVSGEKQKLTLQTSKIENNNVVLPILLENTGLEESYSLWQIGFYAEDPEEGEILYCLSQTAEAKNIPSMSESPGFSITWDFYFKSSVDVPIEVNINSSGLVSIEKYQIHTKAIEKIQDDLTDCMTVTRNLSDIGNLYTDSINKDIIAHVQNNWSQFPSTCVIDKLVALSPGMTYHIYGYKNGNNYGRVTVEVYGNTRKQIGNLYGGTWTWEQETDLIVNVGNDAYWSWRKWSSGFLEMYGKKSWSSIKPTGNGPTYYYNLEIPKANLNITSLYFCKANYSANTYSVMTGTTDYNNSIGLKAYATVASGVVQNITLQGYVAARWK